MHPAFEAIERAQCVLAARPRATSFTAHRSLRIVHCASFAAHRSLLGHRGSPRAQSHSRSRSSRSRSLRARHSAAISQLAHRCECIVAGCHCHDFPMREDARSASLVETSATNSMRIVTRARGRSRGVSQGESTSSRVCTAGSETGFPRAALGKIGFVRGVRVVAPYCILRGSLYLPPSTDPFPHE
jgi:hypothetical protein